MTDKNGQNSVDENVVEQSGVETDAEQAAPEKPGVETDLVNSVQTPNKILFSPDMSTDEKINLLEEWEMDLRERIAAADEGMSGKDYGPTAELLRRVRLALRSLDPANEPAPSGVTPQA